MSGYINALIPLLIGILCIVNANAFVKPDVADRKKKTSIIRTCGWLLAGVGVLFVLIEFFSH